MLRLVRAPIFAPLPPRAVHTSLTPCSNILLQYGVVRAFLHCRREDVCTETDDLGYFQMSSAVPLVNCVLPIISGVLIDY